MGRLVKKLKNNKQVIFDRGKFDDWCVHIVEHDGSKFAPCDEVYFSELQQISKHYPEGKVYNDFLKIYEKTDKAINPEVIDLIDSIVQTYKEEHRVKVEQWFTVIYAGMIAEENKKNTKLGKRIKHLGIYQVLVLHKEPAYAAKFSYHKKWRELDKLMRQYGI